MKYNILFILFLFCFSSCNKLPNELKNMVSEEVQKALDEAGSNRHELEKVNLIAEIMDVSDK
jgi:starvation-inducible outer membrane lipoprotein